MSEQKGLTGEDDSREQQGIENENSDQSEDVVMQGGGWLRSSHWLLLMSLLLVILVLLTMLVIRKRREKTSRQPLVTEASTAVISKHQPKLSEIQAADKPAEKHVPKVAADLECDKSENASSKSPKSVSDQVTPQPVEKKIDTPKTISQDIKPKTKEKTRKSVAVNQKNGILDPAKLLFTESKQTQVANVQEESVGAVEKELYIDSLRIQEDGVSVPFKRVWSPDLMVSRDDTGLSLGLPHGLNMRLSLVPKGTFTMGSDDDDDGRGLHEEEHQVCFNNDFWLGAQEITRGVWKSIMGCISANRPESDNLPMVCVNRYEALAFCGVMNDLYGQRLPSGYVFCLPTSAQWEYASRGGAGGRGFRFSGDNDLAKVGWYANNSDNRLHAVGGKAPNELGLYDMSGNAMEYCLDNVSSSNETVDPIGDIWGTRFGVRGGGYSSVSFDCRVSSFKLMQGRYGRFGTVGFRLALVPIREFLEGEELLVEGKGGEIDDEEQEDDDTEVDNDTEEMEESKEKKKRSRRSGESLLKTRHDSFQHKKAETIDLKRRRFLHTREQFDQRDQQEEGKEENNGKEGKGEKKRRRRVHTALLQTRHDIMKRSSAETIDLEERNLLMTREDLARKAKEKLEKSKKQTVEGEKKDGEDKKGEEKDGEDKKGEKKDGKKARPPKRPLLRTRQDSLEHEREKTIDLKKRKLLQTREQLSEAREKRRQERKEKGEKKDILGLRKGEVALELDKEVSMVLVKIKPGKIFLGSASDEPGRKQDENRRKCKLTQNFWMGKFEVTQAVYAAIMEVNPSLVRGNEQHPVEQISWNEAMDFCARLTERYADKLPEHLVFRLPTEDEWEFCSRGGNESKDTDYSGGDDLDEVGWYVGNAKGATHPVGTLKANELGLHDMSGNVEEWCLDSCARDEYGEVKDAKVRMEKPLAFRIRRGGAWCFRPSVSRVASRGCSLPDFRSVFVGFRVVLGPRMTEP